MSAPSHKQMTEPSIYPIPESPRGISRSVARKLRRLLDGVRRVSIVCHMSPDGDALGSSLALSRVLASTGHSVRVITPDMPPRNLMFLPGADNIIIGSKIPDVAERTLASAEVIFCLDFNDLHRVDRLAPMIEASKARRVAIDHHLDFAMDAEIVVRDPASSSTCALLYHLLAEAGREDKIDTDAATCIYTGMMTDTGNFSYNSNSPDLYLIIARLLEKGIDKDEIYRKAWNETSESRLRICGYAMSEKMELLRDKHTAVISLSAEELNRMNYSRGDTESLVNQPLAIPGIDCSIFLREDRENFVKVSMRSVGDIPVNRFCSENFGGGGHLNAAGGEFHGPLDLCIARVKEMLIAFSDLLTETNSL